MAARNPGKVALSSAERELQFMWQQAELEFSQLTRRNLRADQEKRLEDVLQELEEKYQPELSTAMESSMKSKAKIRDTIGKVLKCVQLLGGLAAQGASIIFGPATLCFNAISFLIDVPGKIASVYEGIGNLFEEVLHSLVLFKIYENFTRLDPDLRDGTHKLMMSMVRICGLSIKIIEGGILRQIKIGAKVTFLNDDSGVRSELVRFKTLVEKQSHVTEAVTLKHVLSNEDKLVDILKGHYENAEKLSNMEGGINTLVADLSDRKMQKITSERVDTIAKMLQMTDEPAQEARRTMQRMKETRLRGSAEWFLQNKDYKDWKTDSEQLPLLLLSGDSKTGKSFLLAAVEDDLRKNDVNMAVAYYKFTGHGAKNTKEKNRDDTISALKSMALQLAGQHKTYSKEMAALRDDFKLPEPGKELFEKQLWDKLLFSEYSQTKEDANIVLLFDGLEELSESNATKFFKLLKAVLDEGRRHDEGRSSANARLRILGTGKPKTFEVKSQFLPGSSLIEITKHNMPDIDLYLENELSADEILQGQHVEMVDLLKSIRDRLPQKANGSFSAIQQKLERIREAVESDAYLDDVEKILAEDPSEDVDKLAHKIISDLNAALSAHEIDQLNELLKWTVFGYRYFTIDELRAALFLNSGRVPLQAFDKKLRNKYLKVFRLSDDRVRTDWHIENLFKWAEDFKPEIATIPHLDSAKISMTINISQGDARTVQQFFWDLTERVGMGRFDFSPVKSGTDAKSIIQCESVAAHYHITDQLLRLLNDEPDGKTKCLVRYALTYLPWHLRKVKEALDHKKLGISEQKAVAKKLIDLLSDVEGVEKFWESNADLGISWLGSDEFDAMRGLLEKVDASNVLEPKERRWVKLHTSDSEGRVGFYKPMTIMAARHWLQDPKWNARDTFLWIDAFMDLQNSEQEDSSTSSTSGNSGESDNYGGPESKKKADDKVNEEGDDDEKASQASVSISEVDRIRSAAVWAQNALGLKEEDLNSLWYERLGDTCSEASKYAAARDWFQKAKDLPDPRWTVNQGWALAVAQLGKMENNEDLKMDACNAIDRVLAHLRELWKAGKAADDELRALVENLKRLASWHQELNRSDLALKLYQEALDVNASEHETRRELFQALYKQNRLDEARITLIRTKGESDAATEFDLFASFLKYLTKDEDMENNMSVLDMIAALVLTDDAFNTHALKTFQSSIQDVRKENMTVSEGILLLYQGIILARCSRDYSQLQQATRCWEDCQSLCPTSRYDLIITQGYAARNVTQHYFNQWRELNERAEDPKQCFTKMQRILRQSANWEYWFRPTSYLASCYVQQDQVDKARELFTDEMTMALDILSDDDPDNDFFGYRYLANILMHVGDDLNALSAWSLLGPNDLWNTNNPEEPSDINVNDAEDTVPTTESSRDTRTGPLTYECDGCCGREWTYANDMYVCRFCPETQFTDDCLEKLKANKLEHFVCHPDHSWLHVPIWSDEVALEVGQGKVKVHGALVDGKREGGETMNIKDWLDELRAQWNVPKLLRGPSPRTEYKDLVQVPSTSIESQGSSIEYQVPGSWAQD